MFDPRYDSVFPGAKTFFIVWGTLFVISILMAAIFPSFIVVAVGGAVFWLWALWGIIGAVLARLLRNNRE